MNSGSNIDRLNNKRSHNIGIVAFVGLVILVLAGLYYATARIDYVWRWYRAPQYFFYQDKVNVNAEIDGDVVSITRGEEFIEFKVSGDMGEEKYKLPIESEILVDEGDYLYMGDSIGFHKKWKPGILLIGLWNTLEISVLATIFGILIGLVCGMARLSSNPFFKWTSITYVEFIRGSPLLVQIFIWYFGIGSVVNQLLVDAGWRQIPNKWYGIAALAFFSGAYVGEIVRAGIQSIHRGQTEAARSLGMTYVQSMSNVILPQAMRRILPPLAGQFINLIKDSSLLGMISIRELTKATREVITTSLQPFELWILCALMYLALTFTLSMILQRMESKEFN